MVAGANDGMVRPSGTGEPVMTAASENVGRTWGAFIAGARRDDVPAAVRHEAKRSILNCLGAALGAASYPAVDAAIATLQPFAGPPQATVIGRAERLDILNASFVNAIGANVLDFDDTHLRTVIYPSAPVAPPLLALAEHRGLGGAELLHAFVLGVEIECRLGNSVSPGHYARGWHITTTCGVLGAAAGSARLLGLDAETTAHALGIAASQSGGIVENLATGAKNIAMGNAARNGLLAALASERGCTAAARAIEGPLGWARAAGDEADVDELLGGLGERWEFGEERLQALPLRHCAASRHRCVPGFTGAARDVRSRGGGRHRQRSSAAARARGSTGGKRARRQDQHSSQRRRGISARRGGLA